MIDQRAADAQALRVGRDIEAMDEILRPEERKDAEKRQFTPLRFANRLFVV
ncbi:MAG: hypothetical protein WDN03_05505 [Rhizomicrobium sp.]